MSLFRAQVEKDLQDSFHNGKEFGEVLAIEIDGREYKGTMVVEENLVKQRNKPDTDHVYSLESSRVNLYIPLVLLGKVPRKGCEVIFQEKLYTILTVAEELGEVILSLEGVME